MWKYLIILSIISIIVLSRIVLKDNYMTNFIVRKYSFTSNGFSADSILKDGNGIMLLKTTRTTNTLPLVLCALESAARVYPDRPVVLFVNGLGNVTSEAEEKEVKDRFPSLSSFHNIYILPLRMEELFDRTPLVLWLKKKTSKKEPITPHMMSDACRIALVWKYGGLYMDSSVISMHPIPLNTFLVPRRQEELSCGPFAFPQFSDLAWWLMEVFAQNYTDVWANNCPALFTHVFKKLCGQPVIGSSDGKCIGIPYLHPNRFYPISYPAWRLYYSVWKYLPLFNVSYGFHVWNYMKQEGRTMAPRKDTLIEHLYRQYCPSTYKYVVNGTDTFWNY